MKTVSTQQSIRVKKTLISRERLYLEKFVRGLTIIQAAGAFGVALLVLTSSASARNDVITMSGNPAPIPGGGVNFGNLIGSPVLNNNGHIAFSIGLVDSNLNGSEAIFRNANLIARSGTNPPGTASGVIFSRFPEDPALNAKGEVLFKSLLSGIGVGLGNNDAIYRDANLIVRSGDDAPGTGSSMTFFRLGPSAMNNNGAVAFHGSLSHRYDEAIYIAKYGLNLIARVQTEAPGTGGEKFARLGAPALNNARDVAFSSYITGPSTSGAPAQAIYKNRSLVARTGNAAPGAGTGVSFSYFPVQLGSPNLNDAGQVAFQARLIGTDVTDRNNQAIYRDAILLARSGDAAPGAGSGVNFSELALRAFNNSGEVAFQAVLSGNGVTSANNQAIYRNSSLIARTGDAVRAPGNGGARFLSFASPIMNAGGLVAFAATTEDGLANSIEGVWLSDGVEHIRVADKNDFLGGNRQINSFAYGKSSLNDYGQLAYGAHTQDGRSGTLLFTPELRYRSSSNGVWDLASNWTLSIKPSFVHDIFINPTARRTVFGPSGTETIRSLTIGGGPGIGTLQLNGGAITASTAVNILGTGVLTGDGVITNGVNNLGTVRADNVTIGGGLFNTGLVIGTGRINTNLLNQPGGQVRVGAGEQMLISGNGHINASRIEVIDGTLGFDGVLFNVGSSGMITGRNAMLRFNSGLVNAGTLALSFGTSDVFGPVSNSGTIINSGAGRLTFYDNVNNSGEIRTSTGGASVFFGNVGGTGSFTGGGTVFLENGFSVGLSPTLMSFGGDVGLGGNSDTIMELGGLKRGDQYDALNIAGALSLGGTLNIALLDGYTPLADSFFDLIAATTINGSFSSVLFPKLSSGLSWNLSLLPDYSGSIDVLRLSAVSEVPVPAAVWLLASGLLGLVGFARHKPKTPSRFLGRATG